MKKKLVVLFRALLLTVVLMTGCNSAESKENCLNTPDGDKKLYFQICTDKEEYRYSETVNVHFTVTNTSENTIYFNGGDEAAMDICERDICWSDEQEQISELTHLVLAPGESRTIEWTWPPSQEYLDKWLGRARLIPFV